MEGSRGSVVYGSFSPSYCLFERELLDVSCCRQFPAPDMRFKAPKSRLVCSIFPMYEACCSSTLQTVPEPPASFMFTGLGLHYAAPFLK